MFIQNKNKQEEFQSRLEDWSDKCEKLSKEKFAVTITDVWEILFEHQKEFRELRAKVRNLEKQKKMLTTDLVKNNAVTNSSLGNIFLSI